MQTNKKLIPKVKFELSPLEMESGLILDFSDSDDMFSGIMRKTFPKLINSLSKCRNKKESIEVCKKTAEEFIQKDRKIIEDFRDKIENDWNKINDQYVEILAKHFETSWSENKLIITSYISILPICPRFLDKFSFCIYYLKSIPEAREAIAHEVLHFLWFKKWKEVFKDSDEKQFSYPHLIWRLSEIMDPIILQCYPEIKNLINPKGWGYQSFVPLKIGEKSMVQYFTDIYLDCLKNKISFEQILKIVWQEAQEHRKVLESF